MLAELFELSGAAIPVMNKKIEELLQNQHGKELFHQITSLLYEYLAPRHCFIGYFDETGKYVNTLSYRNAGIVNENFSYPLAGTPCHEVRSSSVPCCYPSEAKKIFPQAFALQKFDAEAYLGIPIFIRGNEAVGIIVCLFEGLGRVKC